MGSGVESGVGVEEGPYRIGLIVDLSAGVSVNIARYPYKLARTM